MELATWEAAMLAADNLQRVLAGASSPKKLLIKAAIPLFGIRWNAQAVRRVGADRLLRILWSMRQSKLQYETYGRIRLLRSAAIKIGPCFPTARGPWPQQ